ncbi:hypothetical protein VZT92_002151 [Zoarces viviparus]|uniref:Uncharacterized protein n=1 Tax=Zoarces viviparus TaxID=48416 RepID=A0AAW1FZ63_ZOAVI
MAVLRRGPVLIFSGLKTVFNFNNLVQQPASSRSLIIRCQQLFLILKFDAGLQRDCGFDASFQSGPASWLFTVVVLLRRQPRSLLPETLCPVVLCCPKERFCLSV